MGVIQIKTSLWMLMMTLVFLVACGGSGSSGFESRAAAERDAIAFVEESGECVFMEGTLLCPSDIEADTQQFVGPTQAPPFSNTPISLNIQPASGTVVPCKLPPGGIRCSITLEVIPNNLPDGSRLFATFKFQNTIFWESPVLIADISSSTFLVESEIEVAPSSFDDQSRLQIAILVYFPDSNLPLMTQNPLLSEYFADVIYIVTDLKLNLLPIP